jgi:hypothetical protein
MRLRGRFIGYVPGPAYRIGPLISAPAREDALKRGAKILLVIRVSLLVIHVGK